MPSLPPEEASTSSTSNVPDSVSSPPPLRLMAYPRLLIAAAAVVAADQITKTLAVQTLSDGRQTDIIEGALTLRLSFNSGGVFGVGQGLPAVFLVATLLVVVGILVFAGRLEDRRWLIPLGMVLGGGLGNVADRIFRDYDGRVVDFIDLHVWPVFNIADMAIVTGVGFVLLFGFRAER